MAMNKIIDANLFIDDFDAEAKEHIEKIEKAFLDTATLAENQELINGVFRAAHSLKGTAGFFAFEKIVTVSHELESVFSKIKDGKLTLNDEITDIVLQSVDCLKDLTDHLNADDMIDIKHIVETLKSYSNIKESNDAPAEIDIPFNYNRPDTKKILQNASRHGHKIYYVSIGFNRSLGKYYKNPKGMIDSILSIGTIVEVIVNNDSHQIIRHTDTSVLKEEIINALSKYDTTTLELLVTSILEFDLFSIAINVDKRYIQLLSRKKDFHETTDEHHIPTQKPEPVAASHQAFALKDLQQKSADPSPVTTNSVVPKTEAENEQTNQQASSRKSNISIRLDISSINGLMDLANEMILARNRLLSTVSGYEKSITGLKPVLYDLNRLSSEIQEKVMLTRMQPISMIFDKFPRIIRDIGKAVNKDIEVEIFGSDITLDKYLLDSLIDPITQIVKNSADHGVELAERRAAIGKPKKGKITLTAYMLDGSANIEIKDDGAGIDLEALKRKSIERGIVTQEALATMAERDILALMFEPGISTARAVTNLSGRGFGMNIVKTNIEKLGGSVEIVSVLDKGTTMRLKMPLTLSVIRTLIVKINSIQYAVPELNVERIVRVWRATPSRRIERLNNSLVLILNGRIIPIVTMDELDAKAKGLQPPSIEALLEKILRSTVTKCLVLKTDDKSFALLIDEAIETVQTLVKPLPMYLKSSICYSSVTVLGNGDAITILDAEGIIRSMGIEATIQKTADDEIENKKEDEKQIIIFKCSGTEYFALEINKISRIEVVNSADIQEIGKDEFINIAGETVRIVRPENYAPVKKHRYTTEKLYVLTLKKTVSPIGFLASKVLDKVSGDFEFDDKHLYSDFIFGTGRFNEKVLIFLNHDAITEEIEKDKQANKVKKEVI